MSRDWYDALCAVEIAYRAYEGTTGVTPHDLFFVRFQYATVLISSAKSIQDIERVHAIARAWRNAKLIQDLENRCNDCARALRG